MTDSTNPAKGTSLAEQLKVQRDINARISGAKREDLLKVLEGADKPKKRRKPEPAKAAE